MVLNKRLPKDPERVLFYNELSIWLKKHPKIKFKKLSYGLEVDTSTIPSEILCKWLEFSNFELWLKKRKSESL